ncbi:transcriptional regulator [Streptococcus chenjunshii]|uniref:Transcriptional regulator n=1 Tax=Streptococcus chenjunshii TaxID=2173853 RepID=A0A372KNA0_9STRE|nr:helix-turn-helix domain-containing protein [Streptococcus chenjunshii]AXQ79167.1 transcriptional regulator [Streptococcus chenjunshii]RFU51000.1 transcriptional regulator [Streptococcus chenjunshii]RFU53394.1 transcriptional regulator [Streptococcus chenjunshii]
MSNKVSQYGICPFATTQKVLTGKWGLVIIYQLSTGTKRFNELQRLIPGITQTILTRHLRQLETDKIIKRQVFAEVPPRVEYSLTDIGKRFQSVLDAIELWGLDYINELNLTPSQNEAKN